MYTTTATAQNMSKGSMTSVIPACQLRKEELEGLRKVKKMNLILNQFMKSHELI